MNPHTVDLNDIREAYGLILPFIHRTPIFTSRFLSQHTGAEIYLKAELFQKTGSFKPRGAINKVKHLTAEEKSRGIVTVSAGNHAQAAAFAAAMEGIPCTVVMPASAPANKIEATRNYGATVLLHEELTTIFERCEEERRTRNATLLHPFDDPCVIAGQGTIGLEILEDISSLDSIVVGVGGGGLISGIAVALKTWNPSVRVIGVEPEGAPTMKRAFEEGRPVKLTKLNTVADGLAPPYVGELNFKIAQELVDEIILVSDQEILQAVRVLLERTKMLVEPAGAAGIAALLAGKVACANQKTVIVLSGGNVDLKRLRDWL